MSLSILGICTATPPRQIAQADAAYAQTFFPPATHGDDAGRERTLAGIDALVHAHGNGVWARTYCRTRAADTLTYDPGSGAASEQVR